MKNVLLPLFCLLFSHSLSAQTSQSKFSHSQYENQILVYKPEQKNTSEKDYKHGVFILGELNKDVANDPKNFNRADYFNALSALISLNETEENIQIAFEKFRTAEGSCEYFLNQGIFDSSKYDMLREAIAEQIAICKLETPAAPFDVNAYIVEHKLDKDLVLLMYQISQDDQRFRTGESSNAAKQKVLDAQNQALIESLYEKHQTYIGKSLVGEKFEHIMWAVIQHSNVEMMEKYISIVHQAVQEDELGTTPLKMLIDRFYGLKFGYQIFGSQSGFGFEMATEQRRREVEQMFGID